MRSEEKIMSKEIELIEAAQRGGTETVKLLLESGADIHSRDDGALIQAARN